MTIYIETQKKEKGAGPPGGLFVFFRAYEILLDS